MGSFLTTVQSHFKNKDTGRYLGIILAEVVTRHPSVLRNLFPEHGRDFERRARKGELMVRAEWPFRISGRNRIADLALLDTSGNCFGLLEIKIEDKELPNQFADYRKFASAASTGAVAFTVLCKYLGPGMQSKSGQLTLSLSEFCRSLSKQSFATDPTVAMLIDYVKDMGIMFNDVEENDMRMLLRRFFHESKGGGRIAAKANIGTKIPSAFNAVIGNQFVVSELMRDLLGSYRATVDFRIHLENSGSKGDYLEKTGGYIETFTNVPLMSGAKGTSWLYLFYGLTYQLVADRPKIAAYARIDGNRLPRELRDGDSDLYVETNDLSFSRNNSPEKLGAHLKRCVAAVTRAARGSKSIPAVYRPSIFELSKRIE